MHKMMRSPIFLMALTLCIDFVGFGLILPLLPFWSERLGASPVGVGLVLTAYALAQFLFTPLLGNLSDRYGRRPIIFASLLIEALSLALCALAGSLPLLLVARFIGGLGASNIGSAQAVVADVTPIEGRARGMGLIGAAIGLGFVVGPALGGLLAPLGPAVPFWVAKLVALANALLVLRFLPETRWMGTACPPVASSIPGRGVALAGWRQVQRHPLVTRLVVVNLLFTIAFTAMETAFALFTQHAFGWTTRQNGYLFTYIGLLIVLMQGEWWGNSPGAGGNVVSTVVQHQRQSWTKAFSPPWISPACQRSFRIPVGYLTRSCPPEHTGWNVLPWTNDSPTTLRVCSSADGPGLRKLGVPPQASPIQPLTG